MADDISKLPADVQAQIADAGKQFADRTQAAANVPASSALPADWKTASLPEGRGRLPQPKEVEPMQLSEQTREPEK